MSRPVEPFQVTQMIESYIVAQFHDTEKYSNRTLLDESGTYALHTLAAQVYALGYADGEAAEAARSRGRNQRSVPSEKNA